MSGNNTRKTGYVSLTGFSALFVGIGIGRFCYPPLIPALIQHHWFSFAQADYLGATNLAGYVIGAILAWKISHKIPAPGLIKAALLISILTFAGCAFPLPFIFYSLLRLLEGFTGAMIMVLTPSTIFNYIPDDKKGLATGIMFSGLGLGIIMVGSLTPWLVSKGLSAPWYFYALLSIVLFIIFYNGWPASAPVIDQQAADATTNTRVKLTKAMLLLMLIYACNAIGFAPFTVFWVDYITRGLDLGTHTGNLMWLLFGLGGAAGPLLSGLIADKAGIARSLRALLFLDGFSVLLTVISSSVVTLALISFLAGGTGMIITSLVAARVSELVDRTHQKKVWGWMTILFSVLYAGDAYLCSYLFSVTNSYHLLFLISGSVLIGGGIINLLFLFFKYKPQITNKARFSNH
jgi:predicted MFS family arabinose efflux permease